MSQKFDLNEYQALAQQTSAPVTNDVINRMYRCLPAMRVLLCNPGFIAMLHQFDEIKKFIFYAKCKPLGNDPALQMSSLIRCADTSCHFRQSASDDQALTKLVHGTLGIVTELPELLTAFAELLYLLENKPRHTGSDEDYDIAKKDWLRRLGNVLTNVSEEAMDIMWYIAEMCSAEFFDHADSRYDAMRLYAERNINKLRTRYPSKFTEYDAQHRNLAAEAAVLAGAPASDEQDTIGKCSKCGDVIYSDDTYWKEAHEFVCITCSPLVHRP